MMLELQPLRGVYTILTTPFMPDGALDEASLRRVVEATVVAGVDGVTALGVAGEAGKLSDDERRRVLAIVMETVAGRLPVIVGTSRDGNDATIAASREAEAAGAAGLMIAPPTFALPGAGLVAHYRRIADATTLPIVLQDFPPANGVTLTPAALAELVNSVPSITTVKLEDPPTPQRIGQLLGLVDTERVTVIGGAGGLYLLHELRAGATGTRPASPTRRRWLPSGTPGKPATPRSRQPPTIATCRCCSSRATQAGTRHPQGDPAPARSARARQRAPTRPDARRAERRRTYARAGDARGWRAGHLVR